MVRQSYNTANVIIFRATTKFTTAVTNMRNILRGEIVGCPRKVVSTHYSFNKNLAIE